MHAAMAEMVCRPVAAGDHDAIADLLSAAFPGPEEARLTAQLRADGDIALEFVAVSDGAILAYVGFSRMQAPFRAVGLAPVATAEAARKRGIADRLIRAALAVAQERGWEGAFVLGDPAYYGRFGFRTDRAAGFACEYAGPHFMALALQGDALPVTSGEVHYAPAFAALG
ncbi:putative acetyltransferase [Sphingomonas laterariae]|uniref:Putative acetyltransferase n=1 Tax=Edaphosphingomonas laterariae TaxID=861865 RepID=A0A239BG50_9SPHN|nr:N-acetyltransferase [Sphingomonas laterariae]SNS06592.1 putative acetyltransferase [Sphingomonas laterariae]